MKTKLELETKLSEIQAQKKQAMIDYKNTDDENEQSLIAERNMACIEKINLIKWVLN